MTLESAKNFQIEFKGKQVAAFVRSSMRQTSITLHSRSFNSVVSRTTVTRWISSGRFLRCKRSPLLLPTLLNVSNRIVRACSMNLRYCTETCRAIRILCRMIFFPALAVVAVDVSRSAEKFYLFVCSASSPRHACAVFRFSFVRDSLISSSVLCQYLYICLLYYLIKKTKQKKKKKNHHP